MLVHFLTWGLSSAEKLKAEELDHAVFNALRAAGPIDRPTWRRVGVGNARLIEFAAGERAILRMPSSEFLDMPAFELATRIRRALERTPSSLC